MSDDGLVYTPSIIPQDAESLGRGVWRWDLSLGARVIAVGVQADPLKDSQAWWDAQRETMPPYEFLREYGLDFGVWGGKPVFPEYQDRYHSAPAALSYAPNRPLLRGWDVPGPIGVVWLQRVPLKAMGPSASAFDGLSRVHILAEFLMDGSVEAAGTQALAITRELFPGSQDVLDVGDPAAFDKRANDTQSCADILRRTCGIHLRPGPRTITERHEPVRRALLGVMPNVPPSEPPGKLLVDPACARIKEAFRSGYHYKQLPGAQGRYHDVPEKNWASHLMDALSYAIASLDGPVQDAEPQEPLEFSHVLGAFPSAGHNGRNGYARPLRWR
jgi:hypothetical protein